MRENDRFDDLQSVDLQAKLLGPVEDLILLRIVMDFTIFTRNASSNDLLLRQIRCCITVIKMLCNINQHKAALTQMYEGLYSDAAKFGDRGIDLIKQSNAIKAAIEILESSSENWKQAMITKLQNTSDTLCSMRSKVKKKLHNKEKGEHPKKIKRALFKDVECLNNPPGTNSSPGQESTSTKAEKSMK